MIGQIKALDEQESGGYKREGVMEERKLSWGDRRLNPIVRRIPPWVKPNHLSFARVPITLLAAVSLAVGWNAVADLKILIMFFFLVWPCFLICWMGLWLGTEKKRARSAHGLILAPIK